MITSHPRISARTCVVSFGAFSCIGLIFLGSIGLEIHVWFTCWWLWAFTLFGCSRRTHGCRILTPNIWRISSGMPLVWNFSSSIFQFPRETFNFEDTERLPAFEMLILRSYSWTRSTQEALKNWDWSRVPNLQLKNVSILNFHRSVPPEQLAQLQTLCTDGQCETKEQGKATKLICNIIWHICKLQVLVMKCSRRHLTLGDIVKYGRTLHKLRLLDYQTCPRLHTRDTTLSNPFLNYLRRNCPFLKDLNLGFDPDTLFSWFS